MEWKTQAANIDAIETAKHFGIDKDRAVNYYSDSEGTRLNYAVPGDAIATFRTNSQIDNDWKVRIDEDYKKRGKGIKNNLRSEKSKDGREVRSLPPWRLLCILEKVHPAQRFFSSFSRSESSRSAAFSMRLILMSLARCLI